jgi:AICARFT/IMPCHase bienzyme
VRYGMKSAYVRARDADPKSSFDDVVAVSHPVTANLADFLLGTITDAIIAPGDELGTIHRLGQKRDGHFLVLEIDPSVEPPARERRDIYGMTVEQDRDDQPIDTSLLTGNDDNLSVATTRDALLAMKRQDRLNWQIRFAEQSLTRCQQEGFVRLFGTEAARHLVDRSWRDQWAAQLSHLTMALRRLDRAGHWASARWAAQVRPLRRTTVAGSASGWARAENTSAFSCVDSSRRAAAATSSAAELPLSAKITPSLARKGLHQPISRPSGASARETTTSYVRW